MATALFCIALAVFHEARFEPLIGQEMVAHVVLNRANIRSLTPCEVIAEKGQFTWRPLRYFKTLKSRGGKRVHVLRPERLPVREKGWSRAMAVALQVAKRTNNMQNVEFFHADYVSPVWRHSLQRLFVVGRHIFYARKPLFLAKN